MDLSAASTAAAKTVSQVNFSNKEALAVGKGVVGTQSNSPYYGVTVSSSKHGTVKGVLQDDFGFRVDSIWDSLIPDITENAALRLSDLALRAGSQGRASLINKNSSRRYWRGSTPIQIMLPMRFEAFNNPMYEVVMPCYRLQAMALPAGIGKFGCLAPPGPSPFARDPLNPGDLPFVSAGPMMDWASRYQDVISVQLGEFIKFPLVVVKSAVVTFAPRMYRGSQGSEAGSPIGARCDITFETYMVVTDSDLYAMYFNKGQPMASGA